MINKYIAELLKTNTRVIVPDFGAFMVKTTAGSDDKQISFNDFLKYNDGLLVNFITKTESISKEDAQKKIKTYVDAINKELKANQPYKVDDLGYLYKDPRGSVRFKAGADKPETAEKPKAEPVKSAVTLDEKPKAADPVKVETPVVKKADEPAGKPTAQVQGATLNDKLSQTKPPTTDAKPQVKTGTPETKKAAGSSIPPKQTATKPTKTAPSGGNKSGGIIITAAIVVVLGAAAVIGYLNLDTVKGWFGMNEEPAVMVDSAAIKANQHRLDSLKRVQFVKDSIEQVKQDSINKAEELKAKNQKKYYLVAGSFKTKKYAEKFVEGLRADGYNAEIFMERRGFYRVSYNGYVDRQEAFNEYRKMKEKNIEVWVLRY